MEKYSTSGGSTLGEENSRLKLLVVLLPQGRHAAADLPPPTSPPRRQPQPQVPRHRTESGRASESNYNYWKSTRSLLL